MSDITIRDFQPINTWKEEKDGDKFIEEFLDGRKKITEKAKYLIDTSTNRKYLNETKELVRYKCFLLTLGTPFVHSIASILQVTFHIGVVGILLRFWEHSPEGINYSLKDRGLNFGVDILRIFSVPFTFLGLELASIYGLFMPYDGRKLYATLERAQYSHHILAPCFQPNPSKHLLGSDINTEGGY